MSMPSIIARLARAALAAVGATLLAGCAGLATLGAVTAPVDLYVLTPKSVYDPDLPQVAAQIVVGEPTAASSVNTDRIAVKPNAYQVQYFPDARWVDRAPLMVQTRLVESFENSGSVTSVGRQAIGLSADFSLISELREFQAEMGAGPDAPLSVVVQLNIKIVKEPQGIIFASQSFASQADTVSDDMGDVVAAFDQALGRTMKEAVQWTVHRIAEFTDRRGPGEF